MLSALLLNILILCIFKYLHFTIDQINGILSLFGRNKINDTFNLIAPLGISFYTFQMIGYLMDVYWGNVKAEKNYLKVLLFCSFFPQITQGPISEYGVLAEQLFTGHDYSYKNYSWGFQRMLWGFFKKMVIADAIAPCVAAAFKNYNSYTGITVFIAAILYSIQIYADFSGYMDIMCGICEVMGIHLTENFDKPYFSQSVAEYWRRWHMSLGTWFKKYIYYPIGVSKWNRNLGKITRQKFGKKVGDVLPASVALVIVWLATGLWHGASWAYIVWGLLNGLFLILTLWLEGFYNRCRELFHMTDTSIGWTLFRVVRTFILITFIKVLPEVGTLSQGIGLWGRIFTEHTIPKSLSELFAFTYWYGGFNKIQLLLACIGTVMMIAVSLIQLKKPIRQITEKWPLIVRVGMCTVLIFIIFTFGIQNSSEGGGFLYAQF